MAGCISSSVSADSIGYLGEYKARIIVDIV
jgi:hypothetical protein